MLSGLIKFVAGSAVGGAVGVAIGALMAPKSGAETQADAAALIQGAKAEGQRAQQAAEAAAAERFRNKVQDPSALTSQP